MPATRPHHAKNGRHGLPAQGCGRRAEQRAALSRGFDRVGQCHSVAPASRCRGHALSRGRQQPATLPTAETGAVSRAARLPPDRGGARHPRGRLRHARQQAGPDGLGLETAHRRDSSEGFAEAAHAPKRPSWSRSAAGITALARAALAPEHAHDRLELAQPVLAHVALGRGAPMPAALREARLPWPARPVGQRLSSPHLDPKSL